MDKTLELLKAINAIVTTVSPLAGAAAALGMFIVSDLKARGQNVGDFATEIAKFDAAVAPIFAKDAQWRRDSGLA